MKIYHNPRCRKSRETLSIMETSGHSPEIVEYLKTPPSADELRSILRMLGIKAEGLIRKNEDIYKQSYKGKNFSEDEWIAIMIQHPKLIERPIVIKGDEAVIGRPPERVKKLLG